MTMAVPNVGVLVTLAGLAGGLAFGLLRGGRPFRWPRVERYVARGAELAASAFAFVYIVLAALGLGSFDTAIDQVGVPVAIALFAQICRAGLWFFEEWRKRDS